MPGIITSTIAASKARDFASSTPSVAGGGQPHVVALAREQRVEDLAHDLFVVDDEDRTVAAHQRIPGLALTRRQRRPFDDSRSEAKG